MSIKQDIYYDKRFAKRVKFLEKSQFWNKDQINRYQLKNLKFLFSHVSKKIPFYVNYFKKNKVKLSDFKSLKDIRIFPLVDKKIIQKDIDKFLVKGIKKKTLTHRTTGGSTGTPLTVWSDFYSQIKDGANTQHYMKVFDLDIFKYKSVRLYGDKIEHKLAKKNIFWSLKNRRILNMSSYHINRKSLFDYLKAIKKHKPKYIHTRASVIFTFAKFLLEEKIKINLNIKYIFVDGEYLTLGQRKIIESAFSTRLLNIYGHTEGALVGHPCKFSNFLHFMPQNGILELLDRNGDEVTKIGQKGKIISTGFNNLIFPLIRYQTGDVGIKGPKSCKCRRNYKILSEVEGRFQDYIVDKNNNLVPLAPAIFNYSDMNWKGIDEFKIIQKNKGRIKILIQMNKKLKSQSQKTLAYTKKKIGEILGSNFIIDTDFIDKLKKTSVGKYRYLDQKLKINF